MTAHRSTAESWGASHDIESFFGGIRRGVVVSIGASAAWLCSILLFLAFWTKGLTLFQDIVVVVVTLLILGGTILAAWISFGLRFVGYWD